MTESLIHIIESSLAQHYCQLSSQPHPLRMVFNFILTLWLYLNGSNSPEEQFSIISIKNMLPGSLYRLTDLTEGREAGILKGQRGYFALQLLLQNMHNWHYPFVPSIQWHENEIVIIILWRIISTKTPTRTPWRILWCIIVPCFLDNFLLLFIIFINLEKSSNVDFKGRGVFYWHIKKY